MKLEKLKKEIKRCLDWADCQDNLDRDDVLIQLREDIESVLEKMSNSK